MVKKRVEEESGQSGAAYVDLSGFPEVPPDARPRRIYFLKLGLLDIETLRNRGYDPMTLFQLPRGTPESEDFYLRAKAQAIEEGTVTSDKLMNAALELQMKAAGMLAQKNLGVKVKVNVRSEAVEGMLKSWGQSRYTLRGNSTVQAANLTMKQLTSGEEKRRRGGKSKQGVKTEMLKVTGMLKGKTK